VPVVIADNEQRSTWGGYGSISYDYDYPDKMNLKPGSELHDKIVKEITARALDSYNVMQTRHSSWADIDKVITAYIPADAKEKRVLEKDSRKPVSIVVPQTYATLEILLTYLTAAMLEAPLFRFEGRSPEDVLGAILLEKVIDQQCYYTKAPLALHTMFRDGLAYGISAVSPVWISEYGWVARSRQKTNDLTQEMMGGMPGRERISIQELLFEGNEIENIDPYLFLPDPNVAIQSMQKGEFVGWINRTNLLSLLKDEQTNEMRFNCKYLRHIGSGKSTLTKTDSSGRNTRTGIQDSSVVSRGSTTNAMDEICMYVDLIPKDWKLPSDGDGEYPETWLFSVVADQIVTGAAPMNLNHNRKPVLTFAPDYDGYSIAPVSKMEMVNGLQTTLNWLFNSHIANVRKAINDMLVVDPSMINMNDLKDPEPGKLIRLRRSVWGRGVESAIKQLNVVDVTRNNVGDASLVMDLIKAVTGSVDAVSGLRRKTSERVTAEEVKGDRFGGLSRLEKIAKLAGWQVMQDLGYMMASHTQQLMSQETYVKITGQWQDVLMNEYGITSDQVPVSPFDILVAYDVIVKDGSMPGGNFADTWVQMLPQIMQDPEMRQKMDIPRIVKHIMRSLGAKDVNQFDKKQAQLPQQAPQINAQVQPDEEVMKQLQAGNVVPMEGGMIQ
jgi:hypothetical protein